MCKAVKTNDILLQMYIVSCSLPASCACSTLTTGLHSFDARLSNCTYACSATQFSVPTAACVVERLQVKPVTCLMPQKMRCGPRDVGPGMGTASLVQARKAAPRNSTRLCLQERWSSSTIAFGVIAASRPGSFQPWCLVRVCRTRKADSLLRLVPWSIFCISRLRRLHRRRVYIHGRRHKCTTLVRHLLAQSLAVRQTCGWYLWWSQDLVPLHHPNCQSTSFLVWYPHVP